MFTIDLSTKRARSVLRLVTYLIMAVAVGVITWICVLISWGYRFDEKTLSFQQGGLVQFDGFPQGATISIDGLKQSIQTPGKANLAVGQYKISMTKDGYRSWNKTIDLSGGQLLWLNYARLIPQSVETTSVYNNAPNIVASLPSPDRQWMFLQPDANQPNFVLADLRDEKNPKFTDFKLPDNLLAKKDGAYGTIQLVEWDSGSQYVLLRHDALDGRTEYVRLDRSKPDNAVNVTQKFQLGMNEAHFAGNNANVVFATTDGIMRRFDIGANSVSGSLAAGVRHFIVYDNDTLAYTADRQQVPGDASSAHQIVGVYQNRERVVRQYPSSAQVLFDYTSYFGHDYMALGTTDSKTVDILRDPQNPNANTDGSQLFATLSTADAPRWLSFSPNGRMLLAQNNNNISTYDLEEAKSYQKQLSFGAEVTSELHWLDDYYLYTDAGNTFHMFEFDGTNSNDITSVKAGYQAVLSANDEQLFTIGQAPFTDKPVVQRSQMIVK